MDDSTKGHFPIMSATMALGLGQNIERLCCVIHMACGDPAAIGQMVGQCGRNGNPGLGLLFIEPMQLKGKNAMSDFNPKLSQEEDDRMDALAVTPVCLSVVLAVDNKLSNELNTCNELFLYHTSDQSGGHLRHGSP
jgi:superfamily II DNA helicase RecQ